MRPRGRQFGVQWAVICSVRATNVGSCEGITAEPASAARTGRPGRQLARLDHRPRGLPEVAELVRLEARASELKDEIVVTETELSDLAREQGRAERDVEQVRARIDRTVPGSTPGRCPPPANWPPCSPRSSRCAAGKAISRSRAKLMERREGLVNRLRSPPPNATAWATQMTEVAAARHGAGGDRRAGGPASERRTDIVAEVPADLLSSRADPRLTRRRRGRVALRPLRGCHLTLNKVDLNQIRASAPDEVLRCEECGGPGPHYESGL